MANSDIHGGTPIEDPTTSMTAVELRRIRIFLALIVLFVGLVAVYFGRDLLLPVVLAVLFTLTLSPVVRSLARRGVPTPLTAFALVVLVGAGLTAAIYALSGPFGSLVDRAPLIGQELRLRLRDVMAGLSVVQDVSDQVSDLTGGGDDTQQVVLDQGGMIPWAVSSLASITGSLFAALILSMFLMASGDFYQRRIVESVRRLSDKKRALAIVRDVETQVSRYLGAITVINAGLGLCIVVMAWTLGMPMFGLWGALAFVLNFLPFLGAIVGTICIAAVAVVTFDSLAYALLIPAAYLTLSSIEGQIVTPYLVGRRLELNTVSVFLSVILWVWLWGVPGALLAVPILVVVKAIADNVPGWRAFGAFLSSDRSSDLRAS